MKRSVPASSAVGVAALAIGLLLTLAAPSVSAQPPRAEEFAVRLSGANEVPENVHGNDDRGIARVTLIEDGTICWRVPALKLTDGEALPHAGHIHFAPVGVAGPIVVHFFGTGDGGAAPTSYPTSETCRSVDPVLVVQIMDAPDQYYVNLHNATHPSGVVRGQLG